MSKVVLDFTVDHTMALVVENQEVAVMPATLAKKLLKEYAQNLVKGNKYQIIDPLIDALIRVVKEQDGEVNDAVHLCVEFIQERTLIEACAKEDWNKFAVSENNMQA